MGSFGEIEANVSGSRRHGLKAARRVEESLGLVRRARTHVGRRPPTDAETVRKHHRRARKQLTKLLTVLEMLQRRFLERGSSNEQFDQLEDALNPLDSVLQATMASESRTRVFKRVRKAAKLARHTIDG